MNNTTFQNQISPKPNHLNYIQNINSPLQKQINQNHQNQSLFNSGNKADNRKPNFIHPKRSEIFYRFIYSIAFNTKVKLVTLPKITDNLKTDKMTSEIKKTSGNEILKLCLYVIPSLPIIIIILNRNLYSDYVGWHSRQSLIMQFVWLLVVYILNTINAPLISGQGLTLATLWNVLCISILVFAGYKAYIGELYKIPIIYDIASGFIDKNKEY